MGSELSATFVRPITGNISRRSIEKIWKEINSIYLEDSDKLYKTNSSVFYDMVPHELNKTIYGQYDLVVLGEQVKIESRTSH